MYIFTTWFDTAQPTRSITHAFFPLTFAVLIRRAFAQTRASLQLSLAFIPGALIGGHITRILVVQPIRRVQFTGRMMPRPSAH